MLKSRKTLKLLKLLSKTVGNKLTDYAAKELQKFSADGFRTIIETSRKIGKDESLLPPEGIDRNLFNLVRTAYALGLQEGLQTYNSLLEDILENPNEIEETLTL